MYRVQSCTLANGLAVRNILSIYEPKFFQFVKPPSDALLYYVMFNLAPLSSLIQAQIYEVQYLVSESNPLFRLFLFPYFNLILCRLLFTDSLWDGFFLE